MGSVIFSIHTCHDSHKKNSQFPVPLTFLTWIKSYKWSYWIISAQSISGGHPFLTRVSHFVMFYIFVFCCVMLLLRVSGLMQSFSAVRSGILTPLVLDLINSVWSTIFPSACFRFKNIFSFSDAPSSQGYPRDSVTRRSALAMLTVLGYLDMGECASDADCAGLPGDG